MSLTQGKVLVLCKNVPNEGNTFYAQGGIASVTSPSDSFEEHIRDTLRAGAGLCREEIVREVVEQAPGRIEWLTSLGARFDFDKESGAYALGKEGGHSQRTNPAHGRSNRRRSPTCAF